MFDKLPLEIQYSIYELLTVGDLVLLSQVNTRLRHVMHHSNAWAKSTLQLGLDGIVASPRVKQGKRVVKSFKLYNATLNAFSQALETVRYLSNAPYYDLSRKHFDMLIPLLSNLRCADFSNTSVMRDEELLMLVKSCPKLVHLDVSRCRKLTSMALFSITKYCPLLTSLDISFTACATDRPLSYLLAHLPIEFLGMDCSMLITWEFLSCIMPPSLVRWSLNRNPLLTSTHLQQMIVQRKKQGGSLELSVFDCEQLTGQEIEHLRQIGNTTIHSNAMLWDHSVESVRDYIQKYLVYGPLNE
ncbi:hypothetical protein EDD86DRAFT_204246 [Gorgonomyces haynaldii]|nr:hypothetical protein EDD86DRAFT_204246 [Gorgonomyces haynaldii]